MSRRLILLLMFVTLLGGGTYSEAADAGDPVLFTAPNELDVPILKVGGVSVLTTGGGGAGTSEVVAFSGAITPPQLTADQHNYNPSGLGTASLLRLNSDAPRAITGIVGGQQGRLLTIHNFGLHNLTLRDESLSSTAANRFALLEDVIISPDASAWLQYDASTGRWRAAAFDSLGLASTALQSIPAEDGVVSCSVGNRAVHVYVPIIGDGQEVVLATPQVVPGTIDQQLCTICGTDDLFTVELSDGDGVRLSQEGSLIFDSRLCLTVQWSAADDLWRQLSAAPSFGGAGGAQGLQANCEVNCTLNNLPEEFPYVLAPAGDEGPKEKVFSPDGNFYRVRYQADGSLAGPDATVVEVNTCWNLKSVIGPPLAETLVGSVCSNGTTTTTTGIFAAGGAPAASSVTLTPQAPMTSTNVQAGMNELNTRTAAWHLPWTAAGAIVDGTTCILQAKALINSGPSVLSVICADAAGGTIEFNFDTPARYTGGAITVCAEINDPVAAGSVWAASTIAQFRASGQVVNNTWSTPVVASATLTTANAGYFACGTLTPNGAAAGVGRVFIKMTIDNASAHTDSNARVLGGYVSGP
jgi:hypothetical protein